MPRCVAASVRSTFRASTAHIMMTLLVKTAKNEIAPNRRRLKFMLDEVCLTGWFSGFRKAISKRLVAKISSASGVTGKLSFVQAASISYSFRDFAKREDLDIPSSEHFFRRAGAVR